MEKQLFEKNTDFTPIESVRMIINSISDMGIIVTDINDVIVFYNNAAAFYDKMDTKSALGMKYSDLYMDSTGGIIRIVKQTKRPVLDQVQTFHYPSGTQKTTIDSSYPIFVKGELKYILSITRYDKVSKLSLEKAYEKKSKANKKASVRFSLSDIKGDSPEIKTTIEKSERASHSFAPVFLEGETGTGKEMFAQGIHNAGIHSSKPFIAINCAAIPENLLESTLFGTTKGSFTGSENKPGLFEQAKDGTFFLDEINSMPMLLQAKLLRVLQERKVRRIGSETEVDVNCRIIASCNENAEKCIEDDKMRADLYYRLSVIKIEIPPLRDRKADIRTYIDFFVEKYSKLYGVEVDGYTDEFYQTMYDYDWPGNVRELEHVIESSVVMLPEKRPLNKSDLPARIRKSDSSGTMWESRAFIAESNNIDNRVPVSDKVSKNLDKETFYAHQQDEECSFILECLKKNNWNVSRTAKKLGITRGSLQYKMRKYNIKRPIEY